MFHSTYDHFCFPTRCFRSRFLHPFRKKNVRATKMDKSRCVCVCVYVCVCMRVCVGLWGLFGGIFRHM